MPTFNLCGKVAVITGAGTGIGHAIAHCLAECGAHLLLHYHTAPPGDLDTLRKTCGSMGHDIVAAPADFADDPSSAAGIVDEAASHFGRVDILVNNAAVTRNLESLLNQNRRSLKEVFAVNIEAVFLGCQAAATHMVKQGNGGRIINISSVHSRMSTLAAYATSKGAINTLTHSAAVELGKYGITVNAIAPGAIYTERWGPSSIPNSSERLGPIALGRFGQPHEIGWIVAFLASEMAGYITGETIFVDGGLSHHLAQR